jgi:hypothetical protein
MDWTKSVDPQGVQTLALPGETTLEPEIMRARIMEYYAQIRSPIKPREIRRQETRQQLQNLRDLID